MMPQTLTISSVGQITIPRKVRELLNLKPGAKLDIEVDQKNHTFTLKKQKSHDEIFAELKELAKNRPQPNPRAKYMTVGEMSLEQAKHIKGDTWV